MKTKVLYNDSCNICRTEINHYKKLSESNQFEWIDVSDGNEACDLTKQSRNSLYRRLHVIENNEIINSENTGVEDAAPLGFVIALLTRVLNAANQNKRVIWCSSKKKILNSRLSAAGLYWLGFDPNQLIQANVLSEIDQYWVMEECLKCSELAAVVIELAHAKPQFNNRESIVWRRLQLAAESSGVTGFVLRSCANIMETTSSIPESRWGVKPLPSNDWRPMWKLELLKS